jgi:aspartyl-tRNA(Asn)/glutamyl-tRNA(Gln) amidotransferase subunit C
MVSEKEIEKIALLARLSLTDAEKKAYATQLTAILNYFQQLTEVNTEGIEPLVNGLDASSVWREDEVKVWANAETAVREAPEKMGNLFKVPPVVGG